MKIILISVQNAIFPGDLLRFKTEKDLLHNLAERKIYHREMGLPHNRSVEKTVPL